MKSVVTGTLAAALIAIVTSFVLNGIQTESYNAFTANGAKINGSEVGNNLVGSDFKVKSAH